MTFKILMQPPDTPAQRPVKPPDARANAATSSSDEGRAEVDAWLRLFAVPTERSCSAFLPTGALARQSFEPADNRCVATAICPAAQPHCDREQCCEIGR